MNKKKFFYAMGIVIATVAAIKGTGQLEIFGGIGIGYLLIAFGSWNDDSSDKKKEHISPYRELLDLIEPNTIEKLIFSPEPFFKIKKRKKKHRVQK